MAKGLINKSEIFEDVIIIYEDQASIASNSRDDKKSLRSWIEKIKSKMYSNSIY